MKKEKVKKEKVAKNVAEKEGGSAFGRGLMLVIALISFAVGAILLDIEGFVGVIVKFFMPFAENPKEIITAVCTMFSVEKFDLIYAVAGMVLMVLVTPICCLRSYKQV